MSHQLSTGALAKIYRGEFLTDVVLQVLERHGWGIQHIMFPVPGRPYINFLPLKSSALSQCYENGLHCLHWVCNAYFLGNIVYIWSAFKQICLLFGISLTFFAHIYYISLTSLYYVILLVCRLQITTELVICTCNYGFTRLVMGSMLHLR